jgi:hypothetical protein
MDHEDVLQERRQCECHKCTQVRYRMSFQWQIDQAFMRPQMDPDSLAQPSPLRYVPSITSGTSSPQEAPCN